MVEVRWKRGGGHMLQSDGGCERVCIVLVG